MTINDVTVQRDIPVGTAITDTISSPTANSWSNCSNYVVGVKSYLVDSGYKDGARKIFKTNIPGVGIEIGGYGLQSNGFNTTKYVGEQPYNAGLAGNDWVEIVGLYGCCVNASATGYVKLFKIGDITSGVLTGKYGAFIVGNINNLSDWGAEVALNFSTTTVTQVKCSITSQGLTLPIGNVPTNEFGNSPGTAAAKTVTEDLGLNCDAGTNINVKLSGIQNADSTDPSILALSPGEGNATGVGVQLLYNDKPLELNKLLNLKTSTGGVESFPITARYIQTKDTVTAGAANATATLNITYQ